MIHSHEIANFMRQIACFANYAAATTISISMGDLSIGCCEWLANDTCTCHLSMDASGVWFQMGPQPVLLQSTHPHRSLGDGALVKYHGKLDMWT